VCGEWKRCAVSKLNGKLVGMRNDVWAVYECDNGGNKFPSYLISSLSARFPVSRISFPESLGEPLRHYLESFTLLVLFSIALLFPIEHLIL